MIKDVDFEKLIEAKLNVLKCETILNPAVEYYNEVGHKNIQKAKDKLFSHKCKRDEYEYYIAIYEAQEYRESCEHHLKIAKAEFENLMIISNFNDQ